MCEKRNLPQLRIHQGVIERHPQFLRRWEGRDTTKGEHFARFFLCDEHNDWPQGFCSTMDGYGALMPGELPGCFLQLEEAFFLWVTPNRLASECCADSQNDF